jgi:hypothetical protein
MPAARFKRKQPRPDADADFIHLARCGDVYTAERRYGMSRRSLFRLAKLNPKAVKRFGARTLWDFAILDELIEQLPLASQSPAHQQENLAKARRVKAAKEFAAKAEAAAADAAQA